VDWFFWNTCARSFFFSQFVGVYVCMQGNESNLIWKQKGKEMANLKDGFMVKVIVPDIEMNKLVKVNNNETVWTVKMQLIPKLRVLEHGFNYGFFFAGSLDRDPGFLDDSQYMHSYQFPNNVELMLKKKQRIITGIPEKQLEKWNNKKQQKVFMDFISKKAYQKVKEMLQKGFDPNFVGENNETPLSLAVTLDDTAMIALLVQTGQAFLDLRTPDVKTPLHKAAIVGHDRACQSLISLGCWVDAKDSQGLTPLFIACSNAKGEIAKMLLQAGSSFDRFDEKNRTELHMACMKNCPLAVQALISFGADLAKKNDVGNTALHLAASANAKECARALLEAGIDYEIQNNAGDTAFQVGVMGTNWDVADLIGNWKPEFKRPRQLRESRRIDPSLSGLPLLKVPEYIPPPPPIGYKGICPPPLDAPLH